RGMRSEQRHDDRQRYHRADHDDLAMRKVDQPDDPVHHCVAQRHERVDAAQRQPVDQLLQEDVQAVSPSAARRPCLRFSAAPDASAIPGLGKPRRRTKKRRPKAPSPSLDPGYFFFSSFFISPFFISPFIISPFFIGPAVAGAAAPAGAAAASFSVLPPTLTAMGMSLPSLT